MCLLSTGPTRIPPGFRGSFGVRMARGCFTAIPVSCGQVSGSPDLVLALGPMWPGWDTGGWLQLCASAERQGPRDAPSQGAGYAIYVPLGREVPESISGLHWPRTLSCHRVPFWGQGSRGEGAAPVAGPFRGCAWRRGGVASALCELHVSVHVQRPHL